MLMLVHYLGWGALERSLTSQHLPQRDAKGVEIGTDIQADSSKLFRTSELGCSGKGSGGCNRGFGTRLIKRFRESKVDDFRCYAGPFLQMNHDVRRFDIAVDQVLFVHGGQTRGDLCRNLQRQVYLEPAGPFDEVLQGLPFHILHRVEVIPEASAQMENRSNVWMTEASCRARLAHKTKSHRLVSEIPFVDDLQCHRTAQIDVKRFIRDAHRAATQLDRTPVFALQQFIILETLCSWFQCGLDCILQRRCA